MARLSPEVGEINKSIQSASLRRRLPPPATLAHKEKSKKMRLNEADMEAHGFRCKLPSCEC